MGFSGVGIVGHAACFFGYFVVRIILQPVKFTGSDDVLAVYRLPVVAHGNYMKAHVLPLLAKLRALLRVAVVTYVIVGNQLEYKANDSFYIQVSSCFRERLFIILFSPPAKVLCSRPHGSDT